MKASTACVIPTLGLSPYLEAEVRSILEDPGVDAIRVIDNTDGPEFCDPVARLEREHRHDHRFNVWKVSGSIYRMWNGAIAWAATWRPPSDRVVLSLLNDDLELPPGAVYTLSRRLRAGDWTILGAGYNEPCPAILDLADRPAYGSFRHGGIGGFAFALDPRRVEPIPDGYQCWYGDDHLVFATRQAGLNVGVAESVRVRHHASTTVNQMWDRLAPLVERDRELFEYHFGTGA